MAQTLHQYRILLGLAVVLFIIGFFFMQQNSADTSQSREQDKEPVSLAEPEEFKSHMRKKNAFLLDVHIPEQMHIPGTDAFIPYDEIENHMNELPEDKDTPVLVYCRSGSMSKTASETLKDLGYTEIYDLKGGIDNFKAQTDLVALSPDSQELGTVIYGDVATTEFTLTNFSPEPLEITRISTSCSCTSASVETMSVGPYESIPVTVSFDPAVHEDDTDLGDITRTIYIETSHPDYSRISAQITAEVVKQEGV